MTEATFEFGLLMGGAGVLVGFSLGAGLMACVFDYYLRRIAKDVEDAG